MSKLGIARLVINYAVASSAAYCTQSVITNIVEPETTEEKIKVVVGSVVIGSMVAQQARQYVDGGIVRVAEVWENRKQAEQPVESPAA